MLKVPIANTSQAEACGGGAGNNSAGEGMEAFCRAGDTAQGERVREAALWCYDKIPLFSGCGECDRQALTIHCKGTISKAANG